MLKPALAVAALFVASMLVAPTVSQAETINSVRISYADLNLATKVGQNRLQARMAYGAQVVCEIEDSRELALAAATNACRSDALDGAQPAYEAAVAAARRGTVEVLGASAIIVSVP
ncbi:MAG TPA: UrcA family protein [Sphingomicrobium sp.]